VSSLHFIDFCKLWLCDSVLLFLLCAVIPVLILLCLLHKAYIPQIAKLCTTKQARTVHKRVKITKQVEKDPTEERIDKAKRPRLAPSKEILVLAISLPYAKHVRCSKCTLHLIYQCFHVILDRHVTVSIDVHIYKN
jgi:hypothetical protein